MRKCHECIGLIPGREGEGICFLKGEINFPKYEDVFCSAFKENPLVAYAMSKAYQESQKATGPTERQYELRQEMMEEEERDDDWGREREEGFREGREG